jgi:hypothetical protein
MAGKSQESGADMEEGGIEGATEAAQTGAIMAQ